MGRNNGYRGRGNRPIKVARRTTMTVNIDGMAVQRTTWVRDPQVTRPGIIADHDWSVASDLLNSDQVTRIALTEDDIRVIFTNFAGRDKPPTIHLTTPTAVRELLGFLRAGQRQKEHPEQLVHVPDLTIASGEQRVTVEHYPNEDPASLLAEVRTASNRDRTVLPAARRSGLWYLPRPVLAATIHDLQEITQRWEGATTPWEKVYPDLVEQWRQEQSVLRPTHTMETLQEALLQPRIKRR